MSKIVLLGSGELGKEFAISAKRLGHFVVAVDSYGDAPAMQVVDRCEVIDMLDPKQLRDVISFWKPDIIVPEIEAIATEVLYDMEASGIQVVPSARAVNLTMNRDKIRDRAHQLGLRVAKFAYADSPEDVLDVWDNMSCEKVVIKPVMSSSGKGQSVVDCNDDVDIRLKLLTAWYYACDNMRGDRKRVIIEEFIEFSSEITLLTIKQNNGPTLFCDPIGHYQERGDYQYSWQPAYVGNSIKQAQEMAKIITDDLGGAGLFGVEFFMTKDGPIFSELSPRPHDTGMVTLQTQRYTQFDLHLRAVTNLPIRQEHLVCEAGASAVILADSEIKDAKISGISDAMELGSIDVRIFGKKVGRKNRRMGVVLGKDLTTTREAATLVKVQ